MFALKRISGFFVRCVLFYALLMLPWPGLMDGYRAFFRAGGNLVFASFGSAGSVEFEDVGSRDHAKDTRLVLYKTHPIPQSRSLEIKSGYVGYRPTAFLISLVLATPIPWRRRLKALVVGLVLVNLFIALRLGLLFLDIYSNPGPLTIFSIEGFWKGVLWRCVMIFFRAPAGHYMWPAFCWLLVCFRRNDFADLLRSASPANEAADTTGSR